MTCDHVLSCRVYLSLSHELPFVPYSTATTMNREMVEIESRIPSISILIPAYNAARFLAEAIESVLAQTISSWELLIIDDGSIDNTAEIANLYCQKDSRIKLISQINRGVSAARNLAIRLAKGELIAFLDADDKWLPNKLAVHVQYMCAHTNVGISFARAEFLTPNGSPTGKITTCQLTNLKPENFLYTNPTITVSNLVVKRHLFEELDGFSEAINYSEDMEFLFRYSCCSDSKIEGIDQILVQYRTHATGLSSTLNKMEDGWHTFMNKAKKIRPDLVKQHYSSAYASQLQYLARQTLRLGLPANLGVELMHRAVQVDPHFIVKKPRNLAILLVIYIRYLTSILNIKTKLW